MKNKNNNSPWSLKINTASLVLSPAAVGINYIGKFSMKPDEFYRKID